MKRSLATAITLVASMNAVACDEIYFKMGASYKFIETDEITARGINYKLDNHSPIGARFELGKQQGNVSYGISHHSQWLVGPPFNDDKEYSKTEVFIDYKWSW